MLFLNGKAKKKKKERKRKTDGYLTKALGEDI
jgi:hypothetical protein